MVRASCRRHSPRDEKKTRAALLLPRSAVAVPRSRESSVPRQASSARDGASERDTADTQGRPTLVLCTGWAGAIPEGAASQILSTRPRRSLDRDSRPSGSVGRASGGAGRPGWPLQARCITTLRIMHRHPWPGQQDMIRNLVCRSSAPEVSAKSPRGVIM